MPAPWRYAVQVLHEDDSLVQQVPVTVDWEPVREWIRFIALRRGAPATVALGLECELAPVWDEARGAPFVSRVRATTGPTCVGHLTAEVGADYFSDVARQATTELVSAGTLDDGARLRFRPMAFAPDRADAHATHRPRFALRATIPELTLLPGSLEASLGCATPVAPTSGDAAEEVPVLLPAEVLSETQAIAGEAGDRETGGLLVGHLRRDESGAGVFVTVTAQLPAQHVEASSTRLTFTSDTWTAFRSALELRRRDEVALGWWHSHPVHTWCAACPPERRRVCAFRGDFLSAQDRLLHRAVFPRAYSVALVVNAVGDGDPTHSLFGWHGGRLSLRGYHVPGPAGPARQLRTLHSGGSHDDRR